MGQPISLHPANNRYFLYRGKPTVLVTSGEHYGAVINGKFDCGEYLDTLNTDGLNHTRVFSGFYHEVPGSFNIKENTLAPATADYICPWRRSEVSGAFDGGNRFDLDKWDDGYFERLRIFFDKAENLGIVVEFTLFCQFYANSSYSVHWDVCPLNPRNNVNDLGDVSFDDILNMSNAGVQEYEDKMVQKLVSELNGYDNVIFEICNEPWGNGVTVEWEHHVAEVIAAAEVGLPNKHLISRNISNGFWPVEKDHADISVYNFHYANPPEAVRVNYHLNKPIGLNETGFAGQGDDIYRRQAWEFVLAGGALFNNLDYSFAVGFEGGSLIPDPGTPGWGSEALRRQLGVLVRFLNTFDLAEMIPMRTEVIGCTAGNSTATMLGSTGKAYAVFCRSGYEQHLALEVPSGVYDVEWISALDGSTLKKDTVLSCDNVLKLFFQGAGIDIALRILGHQ